MPIDSASTYVRNCLLKCLPEGVLEGVSGDTTAYLWCLADCLSPIVGLPKRKALNKLLKDKGKIGDVFRKLKNIGKKWKNTKAKDAISGTLKKSPSYHTVLAEKTIEELEKLKKKQARTKEEKAFKKKVCQMLKLIRQAERLRKKLKSKKVSFILPVYPKGSYVIADISKALDEIRSSLLSDDDGSDIYELYQKLQFLVEMAPESMILRIEVAHFRNAILDDAPGAAAEFSNLITSMEQLFSEAVPAIAELREEQELGDLPEFAESMPLEDVQYRAALLALRLEGVLEEGEVYPDLQCLDEFLPTLTEPIPVETEEAEFE